VGGIDSKIHTAGIIASRYPSILSLYRTWYWTYKWSQSRFTMKLHSDAESHPSRISIVYIANLNIMSRLVLHREKGALYTRGESRGLYSSFLCPLTAYSHYTFLLINTHYILILISPCSDNQSAWPISKQMVLLQSTNPSARTVSVWYSSPEWLVSVRLLSSGLSISWYDSPDILHIMFNCP